MLGLGLGLGLGLRFPKNNIWCHLLNNMQEIKKENIVCLAHQSHPNVDSCHSCQCYYVSVSVRYVVNDDKRRNKTSNNQSKLIFCSDKNQ